MAWHAGLGCGLLAGVTRYRRCRTNTVTRVRLGPALPEVGRLVSLAAVGIPSERIDPGLTLFVFVGDGDEPRAKVRLADPMRHGRRPLNLSRRLGEVVRVALADPAGAWAGGRPALDLVLGWA